MNYLLAGGFAFLSLFMAKSLFIFTKKEKDPLRKYLDQKDEPILFDYLYKLADEAGAPRPHKVFLSDRVNASVSYDLSILNLIFPSKKNLEIGLGIINTLSLGELKAVLAHEFGHFAQRSMLLGRYVYTAQQVASQIVSKRDFLDDFLSGLSRVDIRIAWIGWILSIFVWAIRSLIETCFSVVALAERALSREMEFQADLVAVSLTGSDALMHALYKLQIADQAYENALEVTNSELNNKKAVYNLYSLQSNFINKMAWILKDEYFGKSPKVSKLDPESKRIFASRTYNPPEMWSTHPADKDREENAKRIYIAAEIDNRSSKELLSKPEKYEIDMTASLVSTAIVETNILTDSESIEIQNKKYFNWTFLHPKYHSTFLNRFPFIHFEKVDDLFNHHINLDTLKDKFTFIYPDGLSLKIDQLKEINEEIDALIISQNEVLTAEKRIVTHRGEQIKRSDIPEIITSLKVEEQVLRDELATHDKLCRTLHFEAACILGNNWSEYLKKLTGLVHYSEHAITNLNDCSRKFHNVLNVALADGHVSSSELIAILDISNEFYYAVRKTYNNSENIILDKELLDKLELKNYKDGFEKFTLTEPDKENIDSWVKVIESWASVSLYMLNKLRNVALEQLLDTEEFVKNAYLNSDRITDFAPEKIELLDKYDLLIPGKERVLQRKLNLWNRFFIGDGLIPTIAKFTISAAMIIGAIFLGKYSQKSMLHIFNGLDTMVSVSIDDQTVVLDANSHNAFPINYGMDYNISTTNANGHKIEELNSNFSSPSSEYIYNIANSGAFVEYPVFYGYSHAPDAESYYLGAKRWFSSSSDYILTEPPNSISLSSGSSGEQKLALTGYKGINPSNLISIIENEEEVQKIIRSHVLWDESESKYLLNWIGLLYKVEQKIEILNKRLKLNPNEVASLRGLQNHADSIQKIDICKEHQQMSSEHPENSDFYYLSSRCIDNEAKKGNAFINGYNKWKDNSWLAFASGYTFAERGQWENAYNAFKTTSSTNPSLSERIALDIERVRRTLVSKTKGNTYDEHLAINDDVVYYTDLESGNLENIEQNPDNVYYLLSQGKLKEAETFIEIYEEYKPYILRMLAASKGASDEVIEKAMNLSSDQGINYETVWLALGLAIQKKMDYAVYKDAIVEMDIDINILDGFIQAIQNGDLDKANRQIRHQNFQVKAHFYTLANAILENKAPEKWKEEIRTILFVNQRPFI